MAEAIPVTRQKCNYKLYQWSCPLDAEDGHDLCIFHLPTDKKKPDDFWRHMASYLMALLDKAGDKSTKAWREQNPNHWVRHEADGALYTTYLSMVSPRGPWCFTGFVFPRMDEKHNFQSFVFASVVFSSAEFCDEANFSLATFSGRAGFYHVMFSSKADFASATFNGEARFQSATFSGEANFFDATFNDRAVFIDATFSGETLYFEATFNVEASFHSARFNGKAYFSYATFNGPVYLSEAAVNALLDFKHARLCNHMLFEGTSLGDGARVLLWDIDFVHGTSDVTMEKGHEKGKIVEPAGQIVFRDISAGMSRVSFLHTDILTDRLLVRFSNVKWKTDPKQFILDARFAFCRNEAVWSEATGLPDDTITTLRWLFHSGWEHPSEETKEQREQRVARELAECVPLVKQDVERIAREIRLSHERCGNYPDAGDYYIAEMAYRERTTPWSKPLLKVGLCFYGLLSRYGESPGRAVTSLFVALALSAYTFVISGFEFMGRTVNRDMRYDRSQFGPTMSDLWLAFRMALANLMPGNLRADVLGLKLTSEASKSWAVAQVICTYILITLLLLAIRRRFRR